MKLTSPQNKMLRKIVATNGGGISEMRLNHSTMWSLHKRGLIQGKRGMQSWAVHTRKGLDWVKVN